MIRVALIGSGNIAQSRHLPNLRDSRLAALHGVYNRTKERSQQVAAEYGGRVYDTPEEIWKDAAVDAAIICTPVESHFELARKALLSGKHVLCEKPLVLTVKEALLLLAAEEQSGKKLMVSYNQRFYAPHVKARELLRADIIGNVIGFRTFLGVNHPQGSPELNSLSAIAEIGSHRIDLIRFLLDSNFARVFAYLGTYREGEHRQAFAEDDYAHVLVQLDNGVHGILASSQRSYNGNDRGTVILGTEGSLTLYGQNSPLLIEKKNGDIIPYAFPDVPAQNEVERTAVDERFFEAVAYNKPVPVSGIDGLETAKVLEAIYRANSAGCWMDVQN